MGGLTRPGGRRQINRLSLFSVDDLRSCWLLSAAQEDVKAPSLLTYLCEWWVVRYLLFYRPLPLLSPLRGLYFSLPCLLLSTLHDDQVQRGNSLGQSSVRFPRNLQRLPKFRGAMVSNRVIVQLSHYLLPNLSRPRPPALSPISLAVSKTDRHSQNRKSSRLCQAKRVPTVKVIGSVLAFVLIGVPSSPQPS